MTERSSPHSFRNPRLIARLIRDHALNARASYRHGKVAEGREYDRQFDAAVDDLLAYAEDGWKAASGLSADVTRFGAALTFYAARSTYEEGSPPPGAFDGPVPINDDKGAIARAAFGDVEDSDE